MVFLLTIIFACFAENLALKIRSKHDGPMCTAQRVHQIPTKRQSHNNRFESLYGVVAERIKIEITLRVGKQGHGHTP